MKQNNNKDKAKKGFFAKIFDKLDKKMEEKAKSSSCCCCQDEKSKDSCCN
jgi:hypothetical protein